MRRIFFLLIFFPSIANAACTTENSGFAANVITVTYKCDTEAEFPTSGLNIGDRAIALDTGKQVYATSATSFGITTTPTITTKGDLATFDTARTRLPVGTNGQILSADSSTATGLKWVSNPTCAQITGSSTLCDGSDATGASVLTNKGDLATFSSVDARLQVGTVTLGNSQVLSVDSASSTGLIWADPPMNYQYLTVESSDSAGVNTFINLSQMSFDVVSGGFYYFRGVIFYTSPITTTGSGWTIDGPTNNFVNYRTENTLTGTTSTLNYFGQLNLPTTANATSTVTGDVCIIEGNINPTASGVVQVKFATEVNASAITAKKGSVLAWKRIQ